MMPNIRTTIHGFEEGLVFELVTKTVVDGDVIETRTVRPTLYFEGHLQPFHARELLIKTEGQRKFGWWKLFTDMALEVDTIIRDPRGAIYRVMSTNDWYGSGYQSYDLTEGVNLSGEDE